MLKIDFDEETERLMTAIEDEYPPEKCSLEEYRDVLDSLNHAIRERIEQLDGELG